MNPRLFLALCCFFGACSIYVLGDTTPTETALVENVLVGQWISEQGALLELTTFNLADGHFSGRYADYRDEFYQLQGYYDTADTTELIFLSWSVTWYDKKAISSDTFWNGAWYRSNNTIEALWTLYRNDGDKQTRLASGKDIFRSQS